MLSDFDIQTFQDDLLHWFERNLRDLPWRKDKDPYRIWVSEIMLQQTRVDTVIPYYERFLERYPTLDDLATAEEEAVLKMWEGLGYYSRARNLLAGVKEVRAQYGSKVPDDPKEIQKIKGIGPYTAGAILSIAYDLPEPAVDGNVMRVLSRLLNVREDISKAKTRKLFEGFIREMISKRNPSYFNQALMELGALICSPRSPKCELCPVSTHCAALKLGTQEQLPVKEKAKRPRRVALSIALIEQEGNLFIRQRPEQGLLAGLWELPNVEGDERALERKMTQLGFEIQSITRLMEHEHIFSHLVWNMVIYRVEANHIDTSIDGRWTHWSQLDNYPFPASYLKIFNKLNMLKQ